MKELKITDIDLNGIDAVIFDLDGTLYDKRWLPLRLIFGDLRHIWLLASERRARRLLKGLDFGDADTFYQTLFNHIASHQNIPYLQAKEWYQTSYLPLTIDILAKHYKAGTFVEPLLKELRLKGIKTVVFSDYRYVDEKLQALGLDPKLFDICQAAPELGGLKPNKTLLMRLVDQIGVPPKRILMIGDRMDTDGAGALTVGMKFMKV